MSLAGGDGGGGGGGGRGGCWAEDESTTAAVLSIPLPYHRRILASRKPDKACFLFRLLTAHVNKCGHQKKGSPMLWIVEVNRA